MKANWRRTLALGLVAGAGAACLPATASEKAKTGEEAGRFYFPNAEPTGSRTVKPGEEVIRRPVVWASSALVGKDVQINSTRGMLWIEANTVLPAVRVSNLPGETGDVIAFCTAAPKFKPKTSQLMFGVLGAKLLKSLSDGRKCLFDKDGDGSAETAFLVDDGEPSDRRPQAIRPVSLNIAQNREAGPGDYVAITLRKASAPSFRIDIFENGEKVAFDSITGGGKIDLRFQKFDKDLTYPVDTEIYGARFSILNHDRNSGIVTVQWSGDGRDAKISVPSEVIYYYRYY